MQYKLGGISHNSVPFLHVVYSDATFPCALAVIDSFNKGFSGRPNCSSEAHYHNPSESSPPIKKKNRSHFQMPPLMYNFYRRAKPSVISFGKAVKKNQWAGTDAQSCSLGGGAETAPSGFNVTVRQQIPSSQTAI